MCGTFPRFDLSYYRPQRSCGKVMYVFTGVCDSVHRGEGMRMAGGSCMAGGMHGGVCMARGVCMAGEKATTADGMHPTGMLSCSS